MAFQYTCVQTYSLHCELFLLFSIEATKKNKEEENNAEHLKTEANVLLIE